MTKFYFASALLALTITAGCGDSDPTVATANGSAAALATSYNTIAVCAGTALGIPAPTRTEAEVTAACNANDINIGTRVVTCLNNGNICGIFARFGQANPNPQALASELVALRNNCFGIAEKANPKVRSSCEALLPAGI